jgi:NTE family protein
MEDTNKKNKIVICGGSIKGFGLLGYLHKLYENQMLTNLVYYCGSSIGSIICLLLLIGYSPSDIFYVLMEIDFETLFNENFDDLFETPHFGIYSTKPIIFIVGKLMKDKKISFKITFNELFKKFNKSLIVTGVCLNNNTLEYFDKEKYPDLEILKAIQISISIPLLFKPVLFNNKLWVDGGCLNNYPIEYFDDDLENVIGINIITNENNIEKFNSYDEYLKQILNCLFKSILNKNNDKYDKYTKNLHLDNMINLKINNEEKLKLYNQGFNNEI